MKAPISPHFSFIVRCWRDANGMLRGWVMDALAQRSYPFATESDMTAHIDQLTKNLETDSTPIPLPLPNDPKGECHEGS